MKVIKSFFIGYFVMVMSCNKSPTTKNETDFKKFIGKSYNEYSDLDPLLLGGAFGGVGNSDRYGLTIFGRKNWEASKDMSGKTLILFTIITGYSGSNPIHKVLDVLYIDLKNYPAGSQIGFNDCAISGEHDYCRVSRFFRSVIPL